MLTVEVSFPHGVWEIEAHYEDDSLLLRPPRGGMPGMRRIVPDSIDGWDFHELVGGKWVAIKGMIDG